LWLFAFAAQAAAQDDIVDQINHLPKFSTYL
jgi:hypothetical protein